MPKGSLRIQYIEDKKKRFSAFSKRKGGLMTVGIYWNEQKLIVNLKKLKYGIPILPILSNYFKLLRHHPSNVLIQKFLSHYD